MSNKVYLGFTPSYDLEGNLVQAIRQKENNTFDIVLQKSRKVQVINLTFEHSQEIGLINLQVLKKYFENI